MVKKKGLKKFNISNKLAYTLMIILSIALLGIGVYAYNSDPTIGTPSVMGHSLGEIQVPTGCTSGQVMKLSATGKWSCGVDDETDSRISITSNGLCYYNPNTICTSTLQQCYASLSLSVDYSPCDMGYLSPIEAEAACMTECSETQAYACDGRVSGCGGTVAIWTDAAGFCEGGGILSCSCTSAQTYSQAISQPAGTYCVVGTRQ